MQFREMLFASAKSDALASQGEYQKALGLSSNAIVCPCVHDAAGVGFAKTGKGNLEVMCGLQRIRSQLKGSIHGMPMLLGPSRKGFLGKLTGGCEVITHLLYKCDPDRSATLCLQYRLFSNRGCTI